jgi:Fe2+ or Zn2+ uptake regulation protein
MATKAVNNKNKRFNLDRSILDIVRKMYSISAEEILLEIEEEEDRTLSRVEVNERLERMLKKNILTKLTLPSDKVVYTLTRDKFLH